MKLTRDDWVEAAYQALLLGGPRAVAVANLAEALGVTRGSFYHYFDDRNELLVAALEKWEAQATDTFIQRASAKSEPVARLRRLFTQVFQKPTELAVAERRILANQGEDDAVSEVVNRVVRRRRAFLADCYQALGYDETEAEDRAMVAYLTFTGWLYLTEPGDRQTNAATRRIAALLQDLLLPTD